MTPSAAMVVHQYLTDQNVFTGDWIGRVGKEPTEPDTTVTLYDLDPIYHGRMAPVDEVMQVEEFQVRIRGLEYPDGHGKGQAIETLLRTVKGTFVTVDGYGRVWIDHINLTMPLAYAGIPQADQNQRLAWLMKAQLVMKPFPEP